MSQGAETFSRCSGQAPQNVSKRVCCSGHELKGKHTQIAGEAIPASIGVGQQSRNVVGHGKYSKVAGLLATPASRLHRARREMVELLQRQVAQHLSTRLPGGAWPPLGINKSRVDEVRAQARPSKLTRLHHVFDMTHLSQHRL